MEPRKERKKKSFKMFMSIEPMLCNYIPMKKWANESKKRIEKMQNERNQMAEHLAIR